MESLSLRSKVAVVTGANSGLGLAIAVLFARRGASVVLCGRDQERLVDAVGQCVEASGGQADRFLSVPGDINDAGVRKNIVDKTIRKYGRLDILVPNAGTTATKMSIISATEESYDAVMNTNLKSIFFLIQAALPHLEKSKGNIVTMSSLASTMVARDVSVYLVSKAALDSLTTSLALDLAASGIRVNAVNPAFARSRIMRNLFGQRKEILDNFYRAESRLCPLHGECITPEAVAELVAFLASDAAKFITGQCHVIDSGRRFMSSVQA